MPFSKNAEPPHKSINDRPWSSWQRQQQIELRRALGPAAYNILEELAMKRVEGKIISIPCPICGQISLGIVSEDGRWFALASGTHAVLDIKDDDKTETVKQDPPSSMEPNPLSSMERADEKNIRPNKLPEQNLGD